MKNKLLIIITLSLLLMALSFAVGCSKKTEESTTSSESEQIKTYTYEEESLTELFKLYFDEEMTESLSVKTFNTSEGHIVINYTTLNDTDDYGAVMREMFTRYINFCEEAFKVEYLDEVRLFVSGYVADEKGNLCEEELFSFWLDKEIYETFTWANMVAKPVYDLIQEYITYPEYNFGVLDTSKFDPQEELYYLGK